jgi:hypothetical protein
MKLISNWIEANGTSYTIDIYDQPVDRPLVIGFPESIPMESFISLVEARQPNDYPGWKGTVYFNAGGVKSALQVSGTAYQVVTDDCVMVYRGTQSDGQVVFDRYVKDAEKETIVMPLRVDPESDQVDSFEDWGYDNDAARVVPVFKTAGKLYADPVILSPSTDFVDLLNDRMNIPVETKVGVHPVIFSVMSTNKVDYLTARYVAYSFVGRRKSMTEEQIVNSDFETITIMGTLTHISNEPVFDTSDEVVTVMDESIAAYAAHFTERGGVAMFEFEGLEFVQLIGVVPGQKFIS